MTKKRIKVGDVRVDIEQGKAGLYYATSPDVRGLLCARHTIQELLNEVPQALADLRAAAAGS